MPTDQRGDRIENYKVHNLIGRGGFGNVYKAQSIDRNQEVAIKFIEKKQMQGQASMLERVKREVEIHSQLKHPSILELFSYFEDESYIYLVLELCHRGDLKSYLKSHAIALTEDEVCHYLMQIVEGLLYLHRHQIIHRDLTLSNLLINKDMAVKIADFGLATQLSEPDEKHFTMCGTPNFISPEVATRSAHGLAADVWSVGCMLYTLLVGQPPFDAPGVKKTLDRVISAEYLLPDWLSHDAKNLISSLLQKDPSKRITLDQILQHPFVRRRTLINDRIVGESDETSFDSGQGDTMATFSPGTINNVSSSNVVNGPHSVPSNQNRSAPSSISASTASSSALASSSRSKVQMLTGVFGGSTNQAEQFKGQPPYRSTQHHHQMQTPVKHYVGTTRKTDGQDQVHLNNNGHLTNVFARSAAASQPRSDQVHSSSSSNLVRTCPNGNRATYQTTQGEVTPRSTQRNAEQRRQQQRDYNPNRYETLANKPHEENLGKTDALSRRLEKEFVVEAEQQRRGRGRNGSPTTSVSSEGGGSVNVASGANSGSESSPTTGELRYDDDGLNADSKMDGLDLQSEDCSSVRSGTSSLRNLAPFHHHSETDLAASDSSRRPQRRLPSDGLRRLGAGSPVAVVGRNCLTLPRQPSRSSSSSTTALQLRSRSVENLNRTTSLDGSHRWSAVPIDIDGRRSLPEEWPRVAAFSAVRLRPTRQQTRNAVAHILENGDVYLEFFKSRNNEERVFEALRISTDGQSIEAYQLNALLDSNLKPLPLPPSTPCRKFTYETLPQRYWKKYEYATRFVNALRSKTVKIILYSRRAKAMLMENSPFQDFEVDFYNGAKFKLMVEGTRIIQRDGTSMTLESSASFTHLSPETQDMWHHVEDLNSRCKQLDSFFTSFCSDGIPCFPLVSGRKPFNPDLSTASIDDDRHDCTMTDADAYAAADAADALDAELDHLTRNHNTSVISSSSKTQTHHPLHGNYQPSSYHPKMNAKHDPQIGVSTAGRPAADVPRPSSGRSLPASTQSTATPTPVKVLRQTFQPGIGRGMQLSNGIILVLHEDGSEVRLHPATFTISVKKPNGQTIVFNSTDKLPESFANELFVIKEQLENSPMLHK